MIKVLFVDDEVLAMEYLKNIIDWNQLGFEIIGQAVSGRKAVEIFEQKRPELVISDIKMVGMDGLELSVKLKNMDPEVEIILLSAYKDFEYAKKGIEYGVSNYLLKHELNEESLTAELLKMKEKLEVSIKKKRIYYQYFAKQLIYNQKDDLFANERTNRFFLVMLEKNRVFINGSFTEQSWGVEEAEHLYHLFEDKMDHVGFLSEIRLTESIIIALFSIQDLVSVSRIKEKIEEKSNFLQNRIREITSDPFTILYSSEIDKSEISTCFQRMSHAIRYSLFLNNRKAHSLMELQLKDEEEAVSWYQYHERMEKIVLNNGHMDDLLHELFGMTIRPFFRLSAIHELVIWLNNMANEIRSREGVSFQNSTGKITKVEEIMEYYCCFFREQQRMRMEREQNQYSKVIVEILRTIRKNYHQELSLEQISEDSGMNAVYLGQLFKKEVGSSFIAYLTAVRIEEAKKILENENISIGEVSERVGYKTSQYFSQIFYKMVHIKPQEYKRWNKKI